MRIVSFTEDVSAEVHQTAAARGYPADVVEGCLAAIALDIGRDFDSLTFHPPDHPERRMYLKPVEALGLVEAICEEQWDTEVLVVRLRVGAFA